MLGRHADAFFRQQARERIVAAPANGDGRSLHVPDRENPGTHRVYHTPGNYEVPGPQHVVDANSMMPGMGDVRRDMLPGMGAVYGAPPRDMLPGMGDIRSMLPGMGLLDNMSTTTKWLLAGGLAVGLGMLVSKRRGRRFAV